MEKYYTAAIGMAQHFGSARIQRLLNFFGSAKSAWTANDNELKQAGLSDRVMQSFLDFRAKNPDAPNRLENYCNEKNIGLCCISDEDYPPILKKILMPPPVFYYCGILKPFEKRIAMVGARNNTEYGKNIALKIAEELTASGFTVVSGAARGIDTFSHIGAMKNGRTVAVLGCGINYALKSKNEKFFREIAEKGVVITAFNPNQVPSKGTFHARDKIIAGLSRGIIGIEVGEKSGSSIACNYAYLYDRDIFAVLDNTDSDKHFGCDKLISEGAIPIKSADDVLKFYGAKLET